MAEKSTLTKKLLRRAFWVWEFFSHSTYNYHTLQGTAFGHALSRIFRRLYPNDPQKAAEKTQKHVGFFNTEAPAMVCSSTVLPSIWRKNKRKAQRFRMRPSNP